MKRPPYLKIGSTIGLVATARKITLEELQPCLNVLESWGFKYQFPKNLFNTHHQFAGTDQQRADDFMEMYLSPDVDAVLCVRGGYGTARILPYLNIQKLKKVNKWLIGYSDVTVLHSLFNKHLSSQTLHATMPINFAQYHSEDVSLVGLKDALQGKTLSYELENHHLNRQGKVQGELVGGNLSVLFSLRATPYDLDFKGKILFIEDLDEYLYHIDRMLTNFSLAGVFKDIAGLVVGGMSDMNDNAIPFGKTAYQIIESHTKAYGYPVMYNFPAGHIQNNCPLKLGAQVELNVEEFQSHLTFLD